MPGQYHGTVKSWLGKMQASGGDIFYSGVMDELVFYDRALNLFEIEVLAGIEPATAPKTILQFEDNDHLYVVPHFAAKC